MAPAPDRYKDRLFHSRMIRPVVGGGGPDLPETNACAWWLETGSKSSTGRFLIHIDAQDAQDFFRRRLACIPGHPQIRSRSSPESASRAVARPVLIILCILCIDVEWRVFLYGPAQSWRAGGGHAGKRELPQGCPSAFREVARRIPPHRTIGRTPPGSAGVPPASCPLGCRSVSLRCCNRPPSASARPKQSHGAVAR